MDHLVFVKILIPANLLMLGGLTGVRKGSAPQLEALKTLSVAFLGLTVYFAYFSLASMTTGISR